ncbi:MAG: hypothetical protein CM15mP92_2520 [Halieaceae bacterium]|nr:MAG: hypothetical protein CM15mP92_2520 [Halieaceae bacterium]
MAPDQTLLGSLTLDPALTIPSYHTAVDIHCQPGGYHTEYVENDVAQGAIYDRAVYIYAMGQMGLYNADMGDSTVAWLKQSYLTLTPAAFWIWVAQLATVRSLRNGFPRPKYMRLMWQRRCCGTRTRERLLWATLCTSHNRMQNALNLRQGLLTSWSPYFAARDFFRRHQKRYQ